MQGNWISAGFVVVKLRCLDFKVLSEVPPIPSEHDLIVVDKNFDIIVIPVMAICIAAFAIGEVPGEKAMQKKRCKSIMKRSGYFLFASPPSPKTTKNTPT